METRTKKPVSGETRKRMREGQLRRRGWEKSTGGVQRKPCSRCKVIMDVTNENFPKDKSSWSGFSHRCKKCCSALNGVVRTTQCFICGNSLDLSMPGLRGAKKHAFPHGVCSLECLDERKKLSGLSFNLWRKYRLSIDDYNAMVENQGNKCAICQGTSSGTSRGGRWNVDHDHATGKVRGLLCVKCNSGLGLFNDSLDVVRAAVAYLEISGVNPNSPTGLFLNGK